jgi:DNA-binding transcriptional MerR regulator
MNRFVKIGDAAKILGISIQTLKRWKESKQLVPDKKTEEGTSMEVEAIRIRN